MNKDLWEGMKSQSHAKSQPQAAGDCFILFSSCGKTSKLRADIHNQIMAKFLQSQDGKGTFIRSKGHLPLVLAPF